MSNDNHQGGNLKVAFFLNLLFVLVEVFGGIWTNSIAILTDAFHDGADCSSLDLAWYLLKLSANRQCQIHLWLLLQAPNC